MPYKSKSGVDAPDFCPGFFKDGEVQPNKFCHGDAALCFCCPCFLIECCQFDCNVCAKCCDPCRPHCKPICGILLECEKTCSAQLGPLCQLGPEIPCHTVGCELTLGQKALEDKLGVWHIATDSYPGFLPSLLFPCLCCPFPPCPGLGQDEEKKDAQFTPGGPTVRNVKIFDFMCGFLLKCALCAPYSCAKAGACGFCMDPLFDGQMPWWFCTEFKPCGIRKTYVTVNTNATQAAA